MVLYSEQTLPMEFRTRNRSRTELFGDIRGGNGTLHGGPFYYETYRKEIQDYTKKTRRFDGTLPPTSLVIKEFSDQPAVINLYEYWGGTLDRKWTNIPLGNYSMWNASPTGGWSVLEKSDTAYVAELLAKSNPYSYTVSIPVMLTELLEAATMFGFAGKTFPQWVSNAYLTNEFGIQPFMQDIRSLHTITSAIEKKIKDLNSLIRRGGLRKKVFLGKKSITELPYTRVSWSTFGKSFSVQGVNTCTSKVWGTVRWRPGPLSEINVDKLTSVNNAIRICLDLKTPDWSTIWEMIPFSWLVDYFVNVGDALQALEMSDLVQPYDICIMRTRTVDSVTYVIKPPPDFFDSRPNLPWTRSLDVDKGRQKYTEKRRTVDLPPPTGVSSLLAYGLMSQAQAQNLTALLISLQRFRR